MTLQGFRELLYRLREVPNIGARKSCVAGGSHDVNFSNLLICL